MKSIKVLFLSLLVSTLSFAADVSNEKLSQLKAFKDIGAQITNHKLIGKNLDLYLVKGKDAQGRDFSIVTDKNGDYLVLTENVFDVKKQKAITIPVDVSILKNKELFTYGTGKDVYYVFTDPECPYCHKFEAAWSKLKDKVTFKVFFFNLDFHQNANAMSRWILSAQTNDEKASRLSAVGQGNTDYKDLKLSEDKRAELNKIIADSKTLGRTLGVQGTPAVFDSNGHTVNWAQLIQ